MKARDLKKGHWYRFFPYSGSEKHQAWYLKCPEDGVYKGGNVAYIEEKGGRYSGSSGHFSDYSHLNGGYTLVSLEEIEQYLPEDQKPRKIKQYEIY